MFHVIKAVRLSLPVEGQRSKISGRKGDPVDQVEGDSKRGRGVTEPETRLLKVVDGSGTC